ncbi:ABC transporter substrate-binding protein [Brevibacterium litoralis]|uniref:ABC transporter substrate-binding protein n=1 Tax=Brevibacterium litoralis TaxID=3138935 RepID=UPI0032EF56BC
MIPVSLLRHAPTTPTAHGTRGRWTALGAGASAAVLLTGCMSGGGGADVAAADFQDPVAGEVAEGSLEGTQMTFVSWGGGYQDGQEQAFVTPFAEASGATVMTDGPTDDAKLQAQVDSGNVQWDMIVSSAIQSAAYCDELYEPLDLSLIDTSQIPEGMPTGECFLPAMSYGAGFFYDADRYGDDPPTGWEDFFDTEAFPGTRGIEGTSSPTGGTFEAALLADGVAPEDLYPLDTDRALEVYASLGEENTAFWTSGAEQTQMIQGGEVDMIFGWSGRVYEANKAGANWKPVWNQAFLASDSLSVSKGSQNSVAAHALINYALGAEQQATQMELTTYSPVNVGAEPEIDAALEEFDVSRPEITEQMLTQDVEYWGENFGELSTIWYEFVSK